jgi:hypothetical protein
VLAYKFDETQFGRFFAAADALRIERTVDNQRDPSLDPVETVSLSVAARLFVLLARLVLSGRHDSRALRVGVA